MSDDESYNGDHNSNGSIPDDDMEQQEEEGSDYDSEYAWEEGQSDGEVGSSTKGMVSLRVEVLCSIPSSGVPRFRCRSSKRALAGYFWSGAGADGRTKVAYGVNPPIPPALGSSL